MGNTHIISRPIKIEPIAGAGKGAGGADVRVCDRIAIGTVADLAGTIGGLTGCARFVQFEICLQIGGPGMWIRSIIIQFLIHPVVNLSLS